MKETKYLCNSFINMKYIERVSVKCMNKKRSILVLFILVNYLLFAVYGFAEEQNIADNEKSTFPETTVKTEYRLLRVGSSGEDVLKLQERLLQLGYDPGTPDGEFGSATQKAIKTFQRLNGLDDDGIAGEMTQSILYSEDAVIFPDQTDPVNVLEGDLPYLVNKEHPVTEFFEPEDLVLLSDYNDNNTYIKIKYKNTMGVREAVQALFRMLRDAKDDGIGKWQVSAGYRTWNDQESLLKNKIKTYKSKNPNWSTAKARSAALKTVAEPGASEHHLGLSFDVNVPGTSSFKGTGQCKWLHTHCWEYGFIIRYPEDKESITGYSAEAWHIRYVGIEHSLLMRDNDLCLEEYIDEITAGRLESVMLD